MARDHADREPAEEDLAPQAVGDVFSTLVNRLVVRGRRGIGRAARAGRTRLELRQLQRDRDAFWMRLGKTAYHLVEAGEIEHPALRKAMSRIDELEARIGALHARTEAEE